MPKTKTVLKVSSIKTWYCVDWWLQRENNDIHNKHTELVLHRNQNANL